MDNIGTIQKRLADMRGSIKHDSMGVEEAIYLIEKARKEAGAVEVTRKDLTDDKIVTETWATETKHLHPSAKGAMRAISRATDTKCRSVTVEGKEVVEIRGFAHDVEMALLMFDLTRDASESGWFDKTYSDEFHKGNRSDKTMMRYYHLQEVTEDMRARIGKIGARDMKARMADPDARSMAMEKLSMLGQPRA